MKQMKLLKNKEVVKATQEIEAKKSSSPNEVCETIEDEQKNNKDYQIDELEWRPRKLLLKFLIFSTHWWNKWSYWKQKKFANL